MNGESFNRRTTDRDSRVTLPGWPLVRDILLFVLGTGGILALLFHWLLSGTQPDEILALIFASMIGLPITLHKDTK